MTENKATVILIKTLRIILKPIAPQLIKFSQAHCKHDGGVTWNIYECGHISINCAICGKLLKKDIDYATVRKVNRPTEEELSKINWTQLWAFHNKGIDE